MEMRHSIFPSATHLDFFKYDRFCRHVLILVFTSQGVAVISHGLPFAFRSSSQIHTYTQNRSFTSDDYISVYCFCSTHDFLSNIIDLLTGTITRTVSVVRERLHEATHDSDDQYCC